MCFAKPPDPKPAPPVPQKSDATMAAAAEQRAALQGRSSGAANILTKLRDEDVAGSSLKKKLGQ